MPTFYLIRHGTRVDHTEGTSLGDIGKLQAKLTGQHLKNRSISQIIASPLKRAQETAKIIAKILRLPVHTDKRLRERLNWGDRKGESYEEFLKEWYGTERDRKYKPPLGDSSVETGNRVKAVLDETSLRGKVLIVSHSGAIADFLRNTFPENQLPMQFDTENAVEFLELSECSITEVEKHDKTYTLKRVNDTGHLPPPIL